MGCRLGNDDMRFSLIRILPKIYECNDETTKRRKQLALFWKISTDLIDIWAGAQRIRMSLLGIGYVFLYFLFARGLLMPIHNRFF